MREKISSAIYAPLVLGMILASGLLICTMMSVSAAPLNSTFDFDTGTPALYLRQPTPFNQTVNTLAARFSSPTDFPSMPSFSVQSASSLASIGTVINSTKFSGFFLWPNTVNRDNLTITFSANLTKITIDFKTAEYHDPGLGGTGSPIRLTAYLNNKLSQVGTATANGIETLIDVFPEGSLSYDSAGSPFNIVEIDLPYIVNGANGFIVDNVAVTTLDVAPTPPSPTPTPTAPPGTTPTPNPTINPTPTPKVTPSPTGAPLPTPSPAPSPTSPGSSLTPTPDSTQAPAALPAQILFAVATIAVVVVVATAYLMYKRKR